MVTYPSDFDSALVSIYARLNTLETHTNCLKECYGQLRKHYDHVSINSEPSSYLPTIKVDISDEVFHARCDIMSEFCLMPKDIYESLNLWGLSEGGEGIYLTNNAVILPIGIAEGVHTKIFGRTVSINYRVIECVGKGQITLGRSLLKLLGAKIDMENGIMTFNSHPSASHSFPKSKVKKGRHRAARNYGVDASSFENT